MLNFTCQYCGKKITAREEWLGKWGKCPACKHNLLIKIHFDKSQKEAGSLFKKKMPEEYWAGKSDEEISKLLVPTEENMQEENLEIAKSSLNFLIPRYDDLALFAFSLSFLLLICISGAMREDFTKVVNKSLERDPRPLIILTVFTIGLVFSFFESFLNRVKTNFEKWIILFFVIGATAGTGLYSGSLMLKTHKDWMMIFPVWNIANGVILLALLRIGAIGPDCITDEAATSFDIISSFLAIIILLFFCHYVFKLHWVFAYSICVCYTLNLHNFIKSIFKGPSMKD